MFDALKGDQIPEEEIPKVLMTSFHSHISVTHIYRVIIPRPVENLDVSCPTQRRGKGEEVFTKYLGYGLKAPQND